MYGHRISYFTVDMESWSDCVIRDALSADCTGKTCVRIDDFYRGEHVQMRQNIERLKCRQHRYQPIGGGSGGGVEGTFKSDNDDGNDEGGVGAERSSGPSFVKRAPRAETLTGWRYTGRYQNTVSRNRQPVHEGPCTTCGFVTQVPFRPVEGGLPPRCKSCCHKAAAKEAKNASVAA